MANKKAQVRLSLTPPPHVPQCRPVARRLGPFQRQRDGGPEAWRLAALPQLGAVLPKRLEGALLQPRPRRLVLACSSTRRQDAEPHTRPSVNIVSLFGGLLFCFGELGVILRASAHARDGPRGRQDGAGV